MEYKIKSASFEDRTSTHQKLRTYLEKLGFRLMGNNNFSRSCYGSPLGTALVERGIGKFETSIIIGTANSDLLENLLKNFPEVKLE